MKNPYKGLESYRENNKNNFYGRDDNIKEFLSIVLNNSFSVLTGKSGLGKTSLLYAGIFPELRKNRVLPIAIRIDLNSGIERLIRDIHQELINQINRHYQHDLELFLRVNNKEKKIQIPVEAESDMESGPFQNSIDDLSETWKPDSLHGYLEHILIRDKPGREWTPCLVFDQFDSIFAGKPDQDLWRQLSAQLKQLMYIQSKKKQGKGGNGKDNQFDQGNYKLIISIRDDYFAQLSDYLKSSSFGHFAYYLLNPMNGQQAHEVIKGPGVLSELDEKRILNFFVENQGQVSLDDINLEDLEIEPAILSLLCTQTFEILHSNKKDRSGENLKVNLSRELKHEQILKEHFTRILSEFSPQAQSFIEDHLITKSGYRTPFRVDKNLSFRDELNKMEEKRLIKKLWIGGKEHIELIHDVVAPIIKDNRDFRRDEMEKRALEDKFVKEREHRERLQTQQAWTLFISVSAVIIFTVLLILMFKAKEQANRERAMAEEAREYADRQALMAEMARDSAEFRRQQAEEALILANRQRNAAIEARNIALEARRAESAAKNNALEAEEKARQRKLTADELAFKEKKATIQTQILNKETFARQLFSRSESLAKGSLTEERLEKKKEDALSSYYLVTSALNNQEEAGWIDSVYNQVLLPELENSQSSDSTRFQILQNFQNNYAGYLFIDNSLKISPAFNEKSDRLIYDKHRYIYEALIDTYVSTHFSGKQLSIPIDQLVLDYNEFATWLNLSSPVFFDISNTGIKNNDIYLTGFSIHDQKLAYAASAGRIMINDENTIKLLNYENDGNSVLSLNFLDKNILAVGKIRSSSRIIELNNSTSLNEYVIPDKGNVIYFERVNDDLFALDENGGFWHWDLSPVGQGKIPDIVSYKSLNLPARSTDMVFDKENDTFIVGCSDGRIYFLEYDFENNEITADPVRVYRIYENQPVLEMALNKSWLAVSTIGSVDIWYNAINNDFSEGLNLFTNAGCKTGGMVFEDEGQFIIFSCGNVIYRRPVDMDLIVTTLEKLN